VGVRCARSGADSTKRRSRGAAIAPRGTTPTGDPGTRRAPYAPCAPLPPTLRAASTDSGVITVTTTERPLEDGWLPDTPIGDTLLRRFVNDQADVNDTVARACGGRVERTDDVFLADAASAVPYYNQALLARPLRGDGDPVLDTVESFFAGAATLTTLLSLWPTPDLGARGWILGGHPAFVVRGAAPLPGDSGGAGGASGVAVRDVATVDDLHAAERVAVEGYPIPEAVGLPPGTVLPAALLDSALRMRVALVDGEPAAVGLSHMGHGVVNLCLGATLPAARRRGAWEALVWARVGDAPDLPAVAYTSDFSRPGFLRMGFLPITRFTLWIRPPR